MTPETRLLVVGMILVGGITVPAAAALLYPVDTEQIEPVDTGPPAPPSTVWSGAMNLPPPLTTSVEVSSPALRGPAIQLTEPPPAPTTTIPTGLWGLPLAPSDLDGCNEFKFYRTQFGLPERFDKIAYRESRCTNTPISATGCCVGYLQIHWINFNDHRMIEPAAACEATWENIRGNDPYSKQRQVCMAAAMYATVHYQPWATT